MNVGGSSRAGDAAEAPSCRACLYCEQTIRGESGGDGEPDTAESSLGGGGDGVPRARAGAASTKQDVASWQFLALKQGTHRYDEAPQSASRFRVRENRNSFRARAGASMIRCPKERLMGGRGAGGARAAARGMGFSCAKLSRCLRARSCPLCF